MTTLFLAALVAALAIYLISVASAVLRRLDAIEACLRSMCGEGGDQGDATAATPRAVLGWRTSTLRQMSSGDAPAGQASEATRVTPHRPAGIEPDVKVPFAQAALSAAIFTLPVALVTLAAQWSAWLVPFAFSAILALAWLHLISDTRSLLRVIERVAGRDLDGDGAVGDPPAEKPTVRLSVHEQIDREHDRLRFLDLPIDGARLIAFARAALTGKRISEGEWVGRGKMFGPTEWDDLRDQMLAASYMRWRHPTARQQGLELTRRGQLVLTALLQRGGSPTPGRE